MDYIGQLLRERAAAEARGEVQPYDAKKIEDELIDSATDWVKDQFMTKEEKEAKAKKKREEIEERERKEREAAGPSLADLFSGFKFGSGRSPFYHMQGAGFGPDGEYIPPTVEDIKKHYDKPVQPPPVFDDEPEELMMQRYYYSQKAPGKYRPDKKRGGMINPFDKDGNLLPQFQQGGFDDFIENERRTTNPFYHLAGAGFFDDVGRLADGISRNKPLTNILGKAGNFLADHAADALFDMVTGAGDRADDDGVEGSGWKDDLNEFVADQLGKLLMGGRKIPEGFHVMPDGSLMKDSEHCPYSKSGGIAHNPKGHTTRNNNLTKQKPQQKKFCGFKSKVFEHEDYDPAKMHKFRAATCGAKSVTKAGRPAGAKNKQGYTKSGQFTAENRRYGQSKQYRERLMGEGKQMQLMPDEDDLVSKKENPVVEKIIHEPMDDGDIRAYFPKARVMRYSELADYDDIEELLPSDKSHVFLLYQHRPNDGHFVCLMRYGDTIEFFCSYGSKIDGPLYWTALKDRQALGEGKPYLSLLLRKAGKRFKAVHNPVAFQSKKQGVATCGAYCVMRINQLVNHNQDLHEFIDWMEEIKKETKLSYDEIAANYVNKR